MQIIRLCQKHLKVSKGVVHTGCYRLYSLLEFEFEKILNSKCMKSNKKSSGGALKVCTVKRFSHEAKLLSSYSENGSKII